MTSVLSTLGRYMTDIGSEVDSYGAWYKTDTLTLTRTLTLTLTLTRTRT